MKNVKEKLNVLAIKSVNMLYAVTNCLFVIAVVAGVACALFLLSTTLRADEYDMHELNADCVDQAMMAKGIQETRQASGDSWEVFNAKVVSGYKKGQPLGDHTTSELIERKDAYYEELLSIAEMVYAHVPAEVDPLMIADSIHQACVLSQVKKPAKKEQVKEYNI